MSGFSSNFQGMLAMTQGTIWNILGMIGALGCRAPFSIFWVRVCWQHHVMPDIHEIFRIWTQEAIGYTVSRLSRLFHAVQTRRGEGLRSRSASCSLGDRDVIFQMRFFNIVFLVDNFRSNL